MNRIFDLEPITHIDRDAGYVSAYPHLLSYFAQREKLTGGDIVVGAHMAYGWMPTVLDLYPIDAGLSFEAAAELLGKARTSGSLTEQELKSLARLVNNSFVGASKLLHFAAPESFAIWDSRVYAFLYNKRPYYERVNSAPTYLKYLSDLRETRKDARFELFHESICSKHGYRVSALRAMEIVMFIHAPRLGS